MSHVRRILRRIPRPVGTVVLSCAAVLALSGTTAASAAPIDLQPEDLKRGADVSGPHIEDRTFVDGDVRVPLPGELASIIDTVGGTSWVGTYPADGSSRTKIFRIDADGERTLLLRRVAPHDAVISTNGRRLIAVKPSRKGATLISYSARTGKMQRTMRLRGDATPLGARGKTLYYNSWESGVHTWNVRTGALSRVTRRAANYLDLDNGLLATYTKDPYNGGCVVLAPLSDLSDRIWRSCRERIEAISPDGQRMATIDLLADGIGPSAVWERTTSGTLLGEYTTEWFGLVDFEDDEHLLLDVNGTKRAATVRCSEGICENASDPRPVESPRGAFRTSARSTGLWSR